MELKVKQKFVYDIISRKVIIEIIEVNDKSNKLIVDTYDKDNGKIISKNLSFNLSNFKYVLNGGKELGFNNIKEFKEEPVCVSDISFKNGQIEDDGAYAD